MGYAHKELAVWQERQKQATQHENATVVHTSINLYKEINIYSTVFKL